MQETARNFEAFYQDYTLQPGFYTASNMVSSLHSKGVPIIKGIPDTGGVHRVKASAGSHGLSKQPLSSTFALFDSIQQHRSWEIGTFMVK